MKKILVIGDSCKDVFVYCHADRLAPDVPVPVLNIIETTENPGMAKNVEQNILAIHANCDLITNPNWEEVTKTRYMHKGSNHFFLRVDSEHRIPRISIHDLAVEKYDLIAISDYDKGFLTQEDIMAICERNPNVFIDTKKIIGDWLSNAKYIKINNIEYARSKETISPALDQKIICTKGELGAEFQGKSYPVEATEIKDITGAGDSFFAALLVRYAETNDIEESIRFANVCAAGVVKKKGVSIIERP